MSRNLEVGFGHLHVALFLEFWLCSMSSVEDRQYIQCLMVLVFFLSHGASCCLGTMKSWVQVLETASCRNAGKDCIHKTKSGQTLPQTLRKQELRAPGCPFLSHVDSILFLRLCGFDTLETFF
jgi:hypothetical protein